MFLRVLILKLYLNIISVITFLKTLFQHHSLKIDIYIWTNITEVKKFIIFSMIKQNYKVSKSSSNISPPGFHKKTKVEYFANRVVHQTTQQNGRGTSERTPKISTVLLHE